jgi:2-polyprenyl-6-methoxyphenol hydroxylase-like FAD-dependent oxidoreductase
MPRKLDAGRDRVKPSGEEPERAAIQACVRVWRVCRGNTSATGGNSMRRVAIVGAGQSSLLLGCDLLRHGYDVTIYSDRTADDVRRQPMASAPFMFRRALDYERELGLNFWDDEDSWFSSVQIDFLLAPGNAAAKLAGELERPGQVLDQRRKHSRWMDEYERRGGKLEIRSATVQDLERLAEENDLVTVAAGKFAGLTGLFAVDEARSLYSTPPRKLTMLMVKGLKPAKTRSATLTTADGEILRGVAFRNDNGEECFSIVFEARPGTPMDDRFTDLSNTDVVARAKEVFHEFVPWEDENVRDIELVHPKAWVQMSVLPVVRKPVGALASGRQVLGIGDIVVTNDPVGAQGANLASKMAKFLAGRIVERANEPFGADWMQQQFDDFWERDARYSYALSEMLLDSTEPCQELMLAAARSQVIADELFAAFDDPQTLWPWIESAAAVREHVSAQF